MRKVVRRAPPARGCLPASGPRWRATSPACGRVSRCRRAVSAIWWPTESTGLSAVMGSWKIMAMALPRMCSSRWTLAVRMSSPMKLSRSASTRPFGGISRIMASAVMLLPLPDSPTIPRTSPGESANDTPSTTRTSPKETLRFSTARSGCSGRRRTRAGRRGLDCHWAPRDRSPVQTCSLQIVYYYTILATLGGLHMLVAKSPDGGRTRLCSEETWRCNARISWWSSLISCAATRLVSRATRMFGHPTSTAWRRAASAFPRLARLSRPACPFASR